MKLSTPLAIILLLAHHQTHALFITSSLPSKTLSPVSALQVSSTSFSPSTPPSSISDISTPTKVIAEATITPKPSFEPGDEIELMTLHQKWHITTYWSCATLGKDRIFCGWHEPVRPGGDEIAAANRGLDLCIRTKIAALAAGALAVAFAALL